MSNPLPPVPPSLARARRLGPRAGRDPDVLPLPASPHREPDLFDLTPWFCCEMDREGRLGRVNGATTRFLGYPAEALVGQRMGAFLHRSDRRRAARAVAAATTSGTCPLHLRCEISDGSHRSTEWVFVADPRAPRVLAWGREVTGARLRDGEAEVRLRRMEDLLMERTRQLTRALGVLEDQARTFGMDAPRLRWVLGGVRAW